MSEWFNSATGQQKGITQIIYTDSEPPSRTPNSLMPSAKLRSANLPFFYVFGVTRSGIEPRPPAPRADTLTTMLHGGSGLTVGRVYDKLWERWLGTIGDVSFILDNKMLESWEFEELNYNETGLEEVGPSQPSAKPKKRKKSISCPDCQLDCGRKLRQYGVREDLPSFSCRA